jgi:hypothetical protein
VSEPNSIYDIVTGHTQRALFQLLNADATEQWALGELRSEWTDKKNLDAKISEWMSRMKLAFTQPRTIFFLVPGWYIILYKRRDMQS